MALESFDNQLRLEDIRKDKAQEKVAAALAALATRLPCAKNNLRGILPWLGLGQRHDTEKKGLYLYGPVGRGKSLLMDIFYREVKNIPKRRVHFHAFMAEIHERLHVLRQEAANGQNGDSFLPRLAKSIASQARLICFDEFQVYNIADAMILGRLFSLLFQEKVWIVATSNVAPENLYLNGLQRDLFLPFIETLKNKLDIIDIGEGVDYRQARLKGLPVYLVPHDNHAYTALQNIFNRLTDTAKPCPFVIDRKGRQLTVPKSAKGVAWFTFDELCRTALSADDYAKLVDHFPTLILENVPAFTEDRRDEILRFIHLVDIYYEHKARLIISAAAAADQLLPPASNVWVQYARTASRLSEMQSRDYLGKLLSPPTEGQNP